MNRIVITGGPGFGKSSIIRELEERKYFVFHEISREILENQKQADGSIVPWKDHHAFNEAVFKGRLEQFHAAGNSARLYFYDRGLPDSLAYLLADEKDVPPHFMEEARLCSYYHKIFYTPPWTDIYQQDEERWEDFGYAEKIHEYIMRFYGGLGYQLIEIPKADIASRVDFILTELEKDFTDYLHPRP